MEQLGAKAEVYVESQGEVRQLCEDHLKIMLQYGYTTLTLLLPIWVMNELPPNVTLLICGIFILLPLSMRKYSPI